MENMLYPVALSLLATPAKHGLWGHLTTADPEEIYHVLAAKGELTVQDFLAREYRGDPLEAAKRIIDRAQAKKISIITLWDHNYSPLLKEISKPPLVLYVKGNTDLHKKSIAIVGTRNSDSRSLAVAERIARELSRNGFCITSGMAMGIDRAAHEAALNCGGETFGVMANGVDIRYPAANRDIYERIELSDNSSLISEYPPGNRADRWTFPRRNRIISGLSLGVVIVKAGHKSGALITARHALEQNREVFACPGLSFEETYAGCHHLLQNGAKLVASTDDILDEITEYIPDSLPSPVNQDCSHEVQGEMFRFDGVEKEILDYISTGDCDINNLLSSTRRHVGEVNEALMNLELDGVLVRKGNIISRI